MSLSLTLVVLLVSSRVRLPWWILVPHLITLLLTVENKTRMPAADKKTLQWDKELLCSRWTEALIKDGWRLKCFCFNLPHLIYFLHFHCKKKRVFIFFESPSVACSCSQSEGCFMKSSLPLSLYDINIDKRLNASFMQPAINIYHILNYCSDISNAYYNTVKTILYHSTVFMLTLT